MRPFLISALFAAALPLSSAAQDTPAPETDAPSGPAEVQNGQAFGDWNVRCEALGVNRTHCMLSQNISIRESGQLLAELLAFWSDDGKTVLVAQVPLGAHLPSGFVLQPEGAPEDERLELVWQTCSSQICEAVATPDQETLDKLIAAERVLAGYRASVGAEPSVFPISTKGLTDGLAALKPAAAATAD